ncbi:uncharacterized protein LOC129592499 [Paramacrobiotus metropolitanus]|uniref:uncharacterized protein LOC129592499 n=1 Tax=Paramacrobiotus metropolitanus TaxID=2943436 RepID=UPI002445F97F|nr:uncharacterized protein LOC129592499 [Paramacrobiotus metropolitanus]
MNGKLAGHLECGICLELAVKAVESTCCHKIFCSQCVLRLRDDRCPNCREDDFDSVDSHLARRIINDFPAHCHFCQAAVTRGNVDDHMAMCDDRMTQCTAPGFKYTGNPKGFIDHIAGSHSDQLLKNAVALFMRSPVEGEDGDRIRIRDNPDGNVARQGASGKYYCGKALNGNCRCCDGFCGPDNGCNCQACMKLDIAARCLPKGYLVNKEGATCRKGTTGLYYCGRRVLVGKDDCDGHCGPTNGPNCSACKMLDVQADDRYASCL